MQLEAEIANGLEHRHLVRLRGGNDAPAGGERLHAGRPQGPDEVERDGLGQDLLLAGGWAVQHRAVLRDDSVEELDLGEERQQVFELAAGDQHELAAALAQAAEGLYRRRRHDAARGQGLVVVAREHVVPHRQDPRGRGERAGRSRLTAGLMPAPAPGARERRSH